MTRGSPSYRFGGRSPMKPATPRGSRLFDEDECRFPGTVMALVGACLVIGIVLGGARPSEILRTGRVDGAAVYDATVTPAAAALRGAWEGLSPADAPHRLVVEEVHPGWAVVQYHWGDHPVGQAQPGWVRVQAKVFPDGRLFWRYYRGDFTFHLAADRTTLVGTREQGGRSASVHLRRT
jgi:hypothetical protein